MRKKFISIRDKSQNVRDEICAMLIAVDKEIDFNALLNKYGPEGLYAIADKLKELADVDVRAAFGIHKKL